MPRYVASNATRASIVARLRCDAMGEFGIGQPVPREEDPYLVRGAGRYVDDVKLIGQAPAYVLRSPHAHARILSIDTQEAKRSPGVLLVLSGNDPELLALGLQRPWHPRKRRDGSPAFISPQPLLARACATSAIRWHWWWRKRWSRPRTPPN